MTCDGISQNTRGRTCNNPEPANGGQACDTSINGEWQTQSCDSGLAVCIANTDCIFDVACNGWEMGGWRLNSGPTASTGTGPSSDHTGTVISSLGSCPSNT